MFGVAGYMLPVLLAVFGVAYLFNFLGYLRERGWWSLLWAVVLVFSLTGLLHLMDPLSPAKHWREKIAAPCFGGWFGYVPFEFGFWMIGGIGAAIVYSALGLISLLFLTNFRLGSWLRRLLRQAAPDAGEIRPEEAALERGPGTPGPADGGGSGQVLRPGRGHATGAGADRARSERVAEQTGPREGKPPHPNR